MGTTGSRPCPRGHTVAPPNASVTDVMLVESLKHARKRQGVSLTQVAARSGLLVQAVARAERAGIDPRVSTVLRIARALELPICEVLEERGSHARHVRRRGRSR